MELTPQYQTSSEAQLAGVLKHSVQPFDLANPPLCRIKLVNIAESQHVFMLEMHHIITDGTSMAIFIQDLLSLYAGQELPPLRLQYKEYSQWQQGLLTEGKFKKYEDYWLEQFPGEFPVLNMITDFPRPPLQNFEGGLFRFNLDTSITTPLNRLKQQTQTTLFMVLLAAYNVLLSRYTGQQDIVIGTTIAGRPHTDLENIIGLLIETLALRNYPRGEQTFEDFLIRVKQQTLNAYENQAYPFKELMKVLGAENEISRNPVFDAMLIVQNMETADFESDSLNVSPYHPPKEDEQHMSKVDFTFTAVERGEDVHINLEYCSRLYKPETMEGFARHFVNVIREVVTQPRIYLSAIDMISQSEKQLLLETFNTPSEETGINHQKTILQRFEEQVEQTPDSIALLGPELYITGKNSTDRNSGFITYRELNYRVDRLAFTLVEKGVKPDTIVAIIVEPSFEMIIGLWGILKSGGAYMPIDTDYPEERIAFMVRDSGAAVLVKGEITNDNKQITNKLQISNPKLQTINLDTIFNSPVSNEPPTFLPSHRPTLLSSSLAYVIYTSGSTGRPKGVLVEHRNLAAYINAFETEFHLGPGDTVIQHVSYAFDAFVEELYPILAKGGKLAIPGKDVKRDIHQLCHFIARRQVTMITCSPQLLNELNGWKAPHLLSSLRIIISGGDRLKAEYIDNLLKSGNVYNTYGPTESTVCATYYRCPVSSPLPSDVSIGKPIHRYQVFILDKYHNLLPIAVGGELCVSGPGVTRGYLNNPDLTAEKFVEIADSSLLTAMSLFYKTGDSARWQPDGNIQFLGRIDRQVKIRGYRIELAEIENRLLALESVKESSVVEGQRKSGQNYLIAYAVMDTEMQASFEASVIKQQLALQLPDYMIPAYIMKLEHIPRTPGGKPLHRQLPSPEAVTDQPYASPESGGEKKLAKLWKEILEVDQIGLDDNFFDIGGTSIDIFNINTRLNEESTEPIPVVAMFQHSTVRSLARYIEHHDRGNKTRLTQEKQKQLAHAKNKGKQLLKKINKRRIPGIPD